MFCIYFNTEIESYYVDLVLTSAGDGVDSRTVILHNGSSATFHSQNASNLQNDVLWRCPPREAACQFHSNHLVKESTQTLNTWACNFDFFLFIKTKPKIYIRTFELPRDSSHDVHSISSTNSYTDATQTTTVRSVGVSADQHHSRIGVVLQNNLEGNVTLDLKCAAFCECCQLLCKCFIK